MNIFLNFIKGILIGIGAVSPGVSGGTLAVIFGFYEKATDMISDVFKDFKENCIFFLPVVLGGVFGIIAFSKLMEFLFINYDVQVKYLFIGLILGTLPSVLNIANKNGFKFNYLIPFIVAFSLTTAFAFLENGVTEGLRQGDNGFISMIIYGAVVGMGTIIPGISSSIILMYLNGYEVVLSSISNVDIVNLVPLGIGFAVSIVIFAKIISILFKKIYGYTYYGVLGFVAGSIIPIFPGFEFRLEYGLSLLLLLAGFISSYKLCKIEEKG